MPAPGVPGGCGAAAVDGVPRVPPAGGEARSVGQRRHRSAAVHRIGEQVAVQGVHRRRHPSPLQVERVARGGQEVSAAANGPATSSRPCRDEEVQGSPRSGCAPRPRTRCPRPRGTERGRRRRPRALARSRVLLGVESCEVDRDSGLDVRRRRTPYEGEPILRNRIASSKPSSPRPARPHDREGPPSQPDPWLGRRSTRGRPPQ